MSYAYDKYIEQIYTAHLNKGNKTNSTVKGQYITSETKETYSDRTQHEPPQKLEVKSDAPEGICLNQRKIFTTFAFLITIIGIMVYVPLFSYQWKISPLNVFRDWKLHWIIPSFLLPIYEERLSEKKVHYLNMPGWLPTNLFQGCDYNCTFSSTLSTSDAVMFYGPDVKATPPSKYPGQIWIIHSLESPYHHYSRFNEWKGKVNWTMTYRRDSDVLNMYANIKKRVIKIKMGDVKKLWESRREGLLVMAASNCNPPSKRMQFVNELRKFIPVHVYGACGQYKCSRLIESSCKNIFSKNYNFYLAFENSLCRDYATEKIFKLFLEKPALIIPITRGDENIYPLLFPPGSYIDVSAFKTIKDLANYMTLLTNNQTTYLTNFRHVTRYEFYEYDNEVFYNLCKKLHHSHKLKRVYADFDDWLKLSSDEKKACQQREI